jgi:hypothetical protein
METRGNMERKSKSESRRPKAERSPKSEVRTCEAGALNSDSIATTKHTKNSNGGVCLISLLHLMHMNRRIMDAALLRISVFGLLSDFCLRPSDFHVAKASN